METPFFFKRFAGTIPDGTIELGTDADPSDPNNGIDGTFQGDNVFDLPTYDVHGNPTCSLLYAISAPNTPLDANVAMNLFVWVSQIGKWLPWVAAITVAGDVFNEANKTMPMKWATPSPSQRVPSGVRLYVQIVPSGSPDSGEYDFAFWPGALSTPASDSI